MKQVEKIQYEVARVITGAWKGTNREKLYANLGSALEPSRKEEKTTAQYLIRN